MLSLSVPRFTSLAPTTSNLTSPRRHFLQRKPISVSIPTATSSKSSLHIASSEPSRHFRRFQLAAAPDSAELDDEFEEFEEGTEEEEEIETGPVEVEEAEASSGDSYEFLEDGKFGDELEDEADEVEEYEEEDDIAIKTHLVLKFVWMEKNIGLALERVVPGGKGSIPLTPYYFWPRKDAWEELKAVLEEKRWVSQKRMIILLNQATDIINLWQQSGTPTATL